MFSMFCPRFQWIDVILLKWNLEGEDSEIRVHPRNPRQSVIQTTHMPKTLHTHELE